MAVRWSSWRLTLALVLTALAAPASFAQVSTTGTINGAVTDTSGAAVTQAIIIISNEATGESRTTTSNVDGTFVAAALPTGSYTVTVSKQGFQTSKETGIVVHPTVVATVNPILKIGEVSTSVEVQAMAAEVQTTSPEISSQITGIQAENLPMNGRNFQSLGSLMPGVTNTAVGTALGGGADQDSAYLSVNGMGGSGTLYLMDGMWNEDPAGPQVSITPPPESVEEMRLLQNNFSVQYNLMGANVFMIQTKSGGSTFHGSAWEFLRNDGLDARNFFSPTVPALKQNIFGFNLGGPLIIPRIYKNRNKTFFFVTEQWRYQDIASTILSASPTAAMRSGLFSDPIKDPSTGLPFPQTASGQYQIPPSMINQSSLALLNALSQLPNNPGGGFLNYINLNPQINRQRDDEYKVDHNFTSKLRLMGELFDMHQSLNYPNQPWISSPFTTNKFTDFTDNYLAQIQLTMILSPAMVNTVSVSTSQYVDNLGITGTWQRSQVPNFNESLPYNGLLSNRLPEVDFTGGWPSLGVGEALPLPHDSCLEDTLTDDWSWLHGNHTIQAGGTVLLGTKRQDNYAQSNGDWVFTGQFSGDPIADFLLGRPASLTQASSETRPYGHYPLVSPYVQDRWKVTHRLTLTVGVRVMYEPEPHAQTDYISAFNPALYNPAAAPIVNADGTITPTANYNPLNGISVNGVDGVPLNLTNRHNWYWSPNVGFAWDIFGDGKTALRGGYGLNYDRSPFSNDCSYVCSNNPPFVQTITLINPQFPSATGGQVAPPSAATLTSTDLNNRMSVIHNYSLGLEHEFHKGWFTSVAYAGNAARDLSGSLNINQPPPDPPYNFNPQINSGTIFPYVYAPYQGYAAINTFINARQANYNALEATLRHTIGSLFVSAAYTYQHALSEIRGNTLFSGVSSNQDAYHPGNDYGSSTFNATQTFSTSIVWNLPLFANAQGLKRTLLGGWKYADVTAIYSGFNLDPGLAIPFQGLATRPDVTGQSLSGPKTVAEWFNTAAFSAPPAGYFGNAGTGIIKGPGLINFDMALFKDFHLTERHRIQFRADLFNVFNHTNFRNVNTTFGDSDFGQVTSAADPRIAEVSMHYSF
jgi:Carboxypeptidase regulatory-like domain/TonB-dependent Receptor Plug Domain